MNTARNMLISSKLNEINSKMENIEVGYKTIQNFREELTLSAQGTV